MQPSRPQPITAPPKPKPHFVPTSNRPSRLRPASQPSDTTTAIMGNVVAFDPALQKYYETNINRFRYFRWTPRTAWISFAYMAIVPSILGYVAYNTDGKYQFRGKRRGDTIKEF